MIDQCHVDIGSLCRRVEAILASRPAGDTRIAFVGDDDLASVCLLKLCPPRHLLLVDIDGRILDVVRTQATCTGAAHRVTICPADLATPAHVEDLLACHGDSWDIVVTDPPYATDGMLRFVEVAMALTAYGGEIHLAVPALMAESWTDELLLNVQSRLVTSGFVIEYVCPGAFTYETSDVVSSLLVARQLPGGPPVQPTPEVSVGRFYTTRAQPGSSASNAPIMGKDSAHHA